MLRFSLVYLVFAVAGASLASSCQSNSKAAEPATPAAAPATPASPDLITLSPTQLTAAGIEIGSFTHKNMTTNVLANGVVDVPPQNRVSISAVLGGYVQRVEVLPGQQVKKGAVVAILRHPDYLKLQQEYLQARARLTFLSQELERQRVLDVEDVGAKRKLQQAQADYATEQATERALAGQLRLLGLAPERLRASSLTPNVALTTPLSGFVKAVNINPGQYANPQDVLVEILNHADLHLELKVFEKDIARLRKNQKILFKVPSSSVQQEFSAHIYLIGQDFDGEARTVNVHAHLDDNKAPVLPGQYVAAQIQTGGARQPTLPEEAVIQAGELSYIFARVGKTGNQFRRYRVQTGSVQSGDVAIRPLDELPDTTQLVRRGAYFLEAELSKGQQQEE
ncbi:efflux RND transporter periplasmic adaptor subunit [Hymenobacter sp. BT635]|uniref:Efflux RND transporter periplasmic adaptor subunit n=1 Tax=Hymenobacter nitidus TaxID=2880929 RepID=A0ABS8ADQ1_9BACT|nr:efflux RND transporter periplasmic adaptor subunit [Hymenobacter nitidus]MCB2378533.1 efflux RND transporter periplasmic adaptor subunit [Hymenobacter nitidus]